MCLYINNGCDGTYIVGILMPVAAETFAAEPIEVFAGIPPVAYLVERIGGDRVHVEVFIEPGQDPHTFEPAPRQIQALGKAKLFFKVGMPFENQLLEKIRGVHPGMTVVDTTAGIKKRLLAADSSVAGEDHADQNSHGHSPEELDPHVWLSPPLVKIMATNIATALEKIDPGRCRFFQGESFTSCIENWMPWTRKSARRLIRMPGGRFTCFIRHLVISAIVTI